MIKLTCPCGATLELGDDVSNKDVGERIAKVFMSDHFPHPRTTDRPSYPNTSPIINPIMPVYDPTKYIVTPSQPPYTITNPYKANVTNIVRRPNE